MPGRHRWNPHLYRRRCPAQLRRHIAPALDVAADFQPLRQIAQQSLGLLGIVQCPGLAHRGVQMLGQPFDNVARLVNLQHWIGVCRPNMRRIALISAFEPSTVAPGPNTPSACWRAPPRTTPWRDEQRQSFGRASTATSTITRKANVASCSIVRSRPKAIWARSTLSVSVGVPPDRRTVVLPMPRNRRPAARSRSRRRPTADRPSWTTVPCRLGSGLLSLPRCVRVLASRANRMSAFRLSASPRWRRDRLPRSPPSRALPRAGTSPSAAIA
jgi:hypothetical protein